MVQRLLEPQVGELLGIGLIGGEQVMAGGTVVVVALPGLRVVASVVAPEASRIVVMPEVVGVRAPRELHIGKNVLVVDRAQCLRRLLDLQLLLVPHVSMLGAIEILKSRNNL